MIQQHNDHIRSRVIIEGVKPEIDGGRYAAKRYVGDTVTVEADIFTDGHDLIAAVLLHRKASSTQWQRTPMEHVSNDLWSAGFPVNALGRYIFTIEAWVDRFETWRDGLRKKVAAGQDVSIDLLIGANLVEEASARAGSGAADLASWAETLRSDGVDRQVRIDLASSAELADAMRAAPDMREAARYPREVPVTVERERARYSTWYEMFPRSTSPEPGRHGTFKDCEARLPYLAGMGFDVLYLPPIHPIGETRRKGKNNALAALPDDVGVPWAIGSAEGGHKSVHPALGSLEDFRQFVERAGDFGIDVAMDIAFQCSPDHPYIKERPNWFRWRPDGTVQYAENPPKRYEDIYPFEFDNGEWKELWDALTSVVLFWVEQGVKIFRIDNPHTKPFVFWEHLIGTVKAAHPEVIFLAEAFTRPKVMYNLAKLGFTQSYTYFAWRNTSWDLTKYLTELTRTAVKDYFHPNFWPNTPDILNEYLQFGGRPAFITRLILAATLASSYGIYGPAFELCEATPREPGSEEYLDSEKYQLRHWNLNSSGSLKNLIARVNHVRRDNPALQRNDGLRFHDVDNEQIICYSKSAADMKNTVLAVVNLDPHHTQSGWLRLDLNALGIGESDAFQVHDQLSDARYLWQGASNYVELNPQVMPAHLFVLRGRVHSEVDFDYFV